MDNNILFWPVEKHGVDASWDPDQQHISKPFLPYHTVHLAYEPLVTPKISEDVYGIRYPNATDMQQRLAVNWSHNNEYTKWQINLRDNVISHAGNRLTSEDVLWSWQRTYALKGVGAWREKYLAGLTNISDIEIMDNQTIIFNLIGPNPQFISYLGFATNNIVDSTEAKKHITEDDPWATKWLDDNPIGYGQFIMMDRTSSEMNFVANQDHFLGKPGIERIMQVGVDSRIDAINKAHNGEFNFLLGLYPEELISFEQSKDFNTYKVRANHSTLEFNWREAPFDEINVRQAINYITPYEQIIKYVYAGHARKSLSPICSTSEFHRSDLMQYSTDLEKARLLMKASNYPDGFETELYIKPSQESLRFAELMRNALSQIGIKIEVKIDIGLPFGTKVPMWFREECGHAMYEPYYDLAHDYDPPLGMWGGKNIVDETFTKPLRAIRSTNASKQQEAYEKIQADILHFAPCVHVAEIDTGWAMHKDVHEWAIDTSFLGASTTVWSAHRQIMGWH
ncbi:MAG: ABC transporter substrate-binding protein [Dehalococcoidia bacterium]|nr:ABC transporter substrate-binding protein [Dehalococcoidia bacterium]